MKKIIALLLSSIFIHFGYAKTSYSIKSDLQKLKNTTTILYLAAHPDDENNLLIGYLARGKHYRTIYFSLTRGDGGQNLIGAEQGVELGILRTEELIKARSVDGGEQYFSHAYDFGFSKTAKETFEHWDQGKLLQDVIQAIRITQPTIIICRFPADKRAGHGHHIASAMLGKMAYLLAGDEHYKLYSNPDLKPWRANALLWNVFDKNDSLIKSPLIKLSVSGIDSSTGKTFQELAAESRSMHKCQGFGVAPDNNSTEEYFEVIEGGSNAAKIDLNAITNQKWTEEKNGKDIVKSIDDLINNEHRYNYETILTKLIYLRSQLQTIQDSLLRMEKLNLINQIILQYTQLRITCYSKDELQAVKQDISFTTSIFNPMPDKTFELKVDNNFLSINPLSNIHQDFQITTNNNSQPTWLNNEIKNDLYD
ncbi:MAG: PIG-L family deacetylase, partial [Bacteroidota bacterium]